MSLRAGKKGELVIDGDVVDFAKELLKNKEYFGALACLHSLIEAWMEELYERAYAEAHTLSESKDRNLKGFRYGKLWNDLLGLRLITSDEAIAIEDFGRLRDRVVHHLVKFQFRPKSEYRIKQTEVIDGFNDGLKIVKLLKEKAGSQFTSTTTFDKSRKGTITIPQQAKTIRGIRIRHDGIQQIHKTILPLLERLSHILDDSPTVRGFPADIARYHSDAVSYLLAGKNKESISASSAAIELAINKDLRMDKVRGKRKKWLDLNPRVLKLAKANGLPVEFLLVPDDDLVKGIVWFIIRRNIFEAEDVHYNDSPVPSPMLVYQKGKRTLIRPSSHPLVFPVQQLASAHDFLMKLYG